MRSIDIMAPILEDGRIHGSPIRSHQRSWSYSSIADEKAGLTSRESFLANGIIDDDCLVVVKATEPDAIDSAPWQKLLARFLFFSGLSPCLLTMWASRMQYLALAASTQSQRLPTWRLVLLYWTVLYDVISAVDGIFIALLSLPLLFTRWRPRLRLLGSNVPSVDVIIPVCNEKMDIIQDTARAALHIDYPQARFRVIISDDGASSSLRDWVEHQQRLGTPNLHYTTRIKAGVRAMGYKAGNLNHAMRVADALPGGRAEYVAGLDADMIPERHWLRAVTAHIVRDHKTGMVCPTQLFYNTPPNDPLYQTSAVNWLCMDVVRDRVGAGWNLGSGWICRRDAVDDIGGFPTNCLVEDIFSSMLMLANGWKTTYLREALQYGLVPESYLGHIKQLTRWYIGGAQMATNFSFYLPSRLTKLMPSAVRALGLSNGIFVHLKSQLITLNLLFTPLTFLTATPLIYTSPDSNPPSPTSTTTHTPFPLLLRIHCLIVLTRWLHDLHRGLSLAGYRTVMVDFAASKWMAPYFTLAWLRSFILPARLGGRVEGFTATGSMGNCVRERDVNKRAPLRQRLRYVVVDCGAWVHVAVVVAFAVGAGMRVWQVVARHGAGEGHEMWVEMLKAVAWPSHTWVPTVLACWTPIRYAVWPPSVPERERLMGPAGKNGVRYAREEARRVRWSGWQVGFPEMYTGFTVAVGGLFVASWWL